MVQSKASLRVVGMIPSRYESTRFPGKPLADIQGKSMIRRVYEQCLEALSLDSVYVATDDERIADEVRSFGGDYLMTSSDHLSGTDRLAEASGYVDADIIVNIQGDQPFIEPGMIDEAVQPLLDDPGLPMSTLMQKLTDPRDYDNPNVVKVVTDTKGFALYFSRSRIPYPRQTDSFYLYEHIGLYVYRKDFLCLLAILAPTTLEKIELLEQLRVIENGYKIKVVETKKISSELSGFSVDTPEDLDRIQEILQKIS
ncbi:MAG: 3-deoxy-manno-octulosonate cytidylyltransferase [Acidobacteriota bacterium]